MAKKKQKTAAQWASEGLKKVKTVGLLKKPVAVKQLYRTGDIVLFKPKDSGFLLNLMFKLQTTFDKSEACHAEIIFSANGDDVVTLGSACDGLKWREQTIGNEHKVLHMIDTSPLTDEQKMKIMEDFYNEKGEQFGRSYPFINTAISGVNRGLDYATRGLFKRIDFGMFSGSADCSATVAQLLYMFYPGKLISRNEDRDLIPPRMVTPGDLDCAVGVEVVKNWG